MKVVWTFGRAESDIEEGYLPPCDTGRSFLPTRDAVVSLFGSKMFFMLQMKNVARECYSF